MSGSDLHAAPPPRPSWVPLTGKHPAAASVTCLESTPNSIIITASIPGLVLSEETQASGIHSRLTLPDAGHTPDIGKPELPVVRKLIVVPEGTTADVAWSATPFSQPLTAFGARGPIRPVQPPVPKIPGARESIPFEKDAATYSRNAWFPTAPVALKEAGTLYGRRLVMVEITPAAYNPAREDLLLYPAIETTITFRGQKTSLAPTPLLPSEASTLEALTLNSTLLTSEDHTPRLLVVAPDAFTNTMAPFVSHKQSLGWTIDLFGTNTAGRTTNSIQDFIRTRYTNLATRPSALLLVGDVSQIPCFTGTQTNTTDLYFACMDGASDWIPEFSVGRLSITSTSALAAVIAKTINAETNSPAAWWKKASFIAGYDKDYYSLAEATHNSVIANHMDQEGYSSDKLYRYSFSTDSSRIRDAFSPGRAFGAYSGHGGEDGWYYDSRNWSLKFGATDINLLTNSARYPFICSFACLTGAFTNSECFAEAWLRAPAKGASAVLASTVNTYWIEDDVLEKQLFQVIFTRFNPSAGESVRLAKLFFMNYGFASTRLYFEMYNLMGDPTLSILRSPLDFSPSSLPSAYVNEPYQQGFAVAGACSPCSWSVLSNALPMGFSLHPSNGIISGTSSSTGTWSFTIQLTDAALNTTSHPCQLSVAERLHPPAHTTLPVAVSNRAYLAGLSAPGGLPPVTWAWTSSYLTSSIAFTWIGNGATNFWRDDDASWFLPLPWPFPFFGQSHTSLWVCSNGFLDFGGGQPAYANSTAALAANRRIAALWDDLDTSSGNIFVTTNADYVAIRLAGKTFSASTAVNVETVLYRSGLIAFHYGSPAHASLSPTIGISAGNGTDYFLSPRNAQSSIPANTSEAFLPVSPVSGLFFSASGVITGIPSHLGSFCIPCHVRDSAIPSQTTTFNLYLTVYDSQTATTQGTPVWWLASHGLTNDTFSSEDLLDRDQDGMPAWQEYVAGTDPTTPASALRLLGLSWSNGVPLLQWQSADSPFTSPPPYTIWYSSNLLSRQWIPMTNVRERTPPVNEAALSPLSSPMPAFFRITITNQSGTLP